MKIYLAYLMFSFVTGLLFWKARPKRRELALAIVCLLICFIYFFFDQL
jgi:dolichyl-phosphate-mannose--protein O-mannosyl transferase